MRRLLNLLFLFVSAIAAEAHLGNENNTEVRIYSDTMRVVIRTSIPFAWTLLVDGAPAMADEAGQAMVRPRLIALAPGLITVTAGGKPLVPTKVDCVFEVEKDVAFVLTYERPAEWPAVVTANFFDRFTSLDTGTISVFDYSASRFSRDLEPIATGVIDQRSPSLSFTLKAANRPASSPVAVAPRPPAEPPPAEGFSKVALGLILLLSAAVIGLLAWHRLRATDRRL